jgi:hypothetical protein
LWIPDLRPPDPTTETKEKGEKGCCPDKYLKNLKLFYLMGDFSYLGAHEIGMNSLCSYPGTRGEELQPVKTIIISFTFKTLMILTELRIRIGFSLDPCGSGIGTWSDFAFT